MMSQPFQRTGRSLSPFEVRTFESLGLTPGHWAALAPVPLLQPDLRPVDKRDSLTLHTLRLLLGESDRLGQEAELFWARLGQQIAHRSDRGADPEWLLSLKLLAWHLVNDQSRTLREAYLEALERAVNHFTQEGEDRQRPLHVVALVRSHIECYLGINQFDPELTPAELGSCNSPDLVHQLAGLPTRERELLFWQMSQATPFKDRLSAEEIDHLREKVEKLILAARTRSVTEHISVDISRSTDRNPMSVNSVTRHDPVKEPLPDSPASLTVEIAEPFKMVTLAEAIKLAQSVSIAAVRDWLAMPESNRQLLFDDCRSQCPAVAIVHNQNQVPGVLWVIGDLHADLLALANIIAHAERIGQAEDKPPAYLFLGDFLDRGHYDHETLLFLFGLILQNPSRVGVIAGNHDVDLQWNADRNRFQVSIEPAEYCERLNQILESGRHVHSDQVELARLLTVFWSSRPKAVILPDGTMFSHAGFPHTDIHPSLHQALDLGQSRCVSDFLWARISDRPRKRPNRANRGHEFGWNDFAEFCRLSGRLGVPPVRRLVRGHDHVPNRWAYLPEYAEYPVLTINAMARWMDGETMDLAKPHPLPVMARHRPGHLPAIIRLPLDPMEVELALAKSNENRGEQPPLGGRV